MNRIILYTCFLIVICYLFTECNRDHTISHYFDEYSYDGNIIKKEVMAYRITKLEPFEAKVSVLRNEPFKTEYTEKIYSNGIYRSYDKKYSIFYPLDSIGRELVRAYPECDFISFPKVFYIGKKKFTLSNKEFFIFKFLEIDGDIGMQSYFLKDFGFIAYDFSNGKYYLCTNYTGNENLSIDNLKEICTNLVNDTSFFSIYENTK